MIEQKSKEITEEMIRDSNYILNKECMKVSVWTILAKGYRMEFRRPKGNS